MKQSLLVQVDERIATKAALRAAARGETLSDVVETALKRYVTVSESNAVGGYARAQKLSRRKLSQAGRKAAQARWKKAKA